jgi:transcriptional regulator with XRE-family HTH domain
MITVEEMNRLRNMLAKLPAVTEDARRFVHEARQRRRLSVRAAANQMRIPPSTLARFERGDTNPAFDTLLAVLEWIATLSETQEFPHGAGR